MLNKIDLNKIETSHFSELSRKQRQFCISEFFGVKNWPTFTKLAGRFNIQTSKVARMILNHLSELKFDEWIKKPLAYWAKLTGAKSLSHISKVFSELERIGIVKIERQKLFRTHNHFNNVKLNYEYFVKNISFFQNIRNNVRASLIKNRNKLAQTLAKRVKSLNPDIEISKFDLIKKYSVQTLEKLNKNWVGFKANNDRVKKELANHSKEESLKLENLTSLKSSLQNLKTQIEKEEYFLNQNILETQQNINDVPEILDAHKYESSDQIENWLNEFLPDLKSIS